MSMHIHVVDIVGNGMKKLMYSDSMRVGRKTRNMLNTCVGSHVQPKPGLRTRVLLYVTHGLSHDTDADGRNIFHDLCCDVKQGHVLFTELSTACTAFDIKQLVNTNDNFSRCPLDLAITNRNSLLIDEMITCQLVDLAYTNLYGRGVFEQLFSYFPDAYVKATIRKVFDVRREDLLRMDLSNFTAFSLLSVIVGCSLHDIDHPSLLHRLFEEYKYTVCKRDVQFVLNLYHVLQGDVRWVKETVKKILQLYTPISTFPNSVGTHGDVFYTAMICEHYDVGRQLLDYDINLCAQSAFFEVGVCEDKLFRQVSFIAKNDVIVPPTRSFDHHMNPVWPKKPQRLSDYFVDTVHKPHKLRAILSAGYLKVYDLLLDTFGPSRINVNRHSVLLHRNTIKNIAVVKKVLSHPFVNCMIEDTESGNNPLHLACMYADRFVVECILSHKCYHVKPRRVFTQNHDNKCALYYARNKPGIMQVFQSFFFIHKIRKDISFTEME